MKGEKYTFEAYHFYCALPPVTARKLTEIIKCNREYARKIMKGYRTLSRAVWDIVRDYLIGKIALGEAHERVDYLKSLPKRRDSDYFFPRDFVLSVEKENREHFRKLGIVL